MNPWRVEPYVDCVVENKDGTKRIGRIEKGPGGRENDFFTLASYQTRKVSVVWPFKNVANVSAIDFEATNIGGE